VSRQRHVNRRQRRIRVEPGDVLPKLVRIGLIAFIFNLGGGMIAPALPLYARSLGADYRDLGLIGAAYGFAFAGLTIPLGRASDYLGRRVLLVASALTMAAATLCYLAAHGVLGLVLGRLLEAVGWAAFWPSLEAWVAEDFGERSATGMGIAYGSYAAAFVIGTSSAGFVIAAAGLRAPFFVYLGTALAAFGVFLAMPVQRSTAEDGTTIRAGASARFGTFHNGSARRQRVLGYVTGFVYVFGLGTVLAFLPAYAADRGFAPQAVGLLLGGYWCGRMLASVTAGRLSDRWGRRAILVPALIGSAAGGCLVAMPLGTVVFFAGTIILGVTSGACAPVCIGLIADHTAPADRGIAMGLFECSCGLSFILAGFIGGQAAYALGAHVPYLIMAAIAALWAPLLSRQITSSPGTRAGLASEPGATL
jgi:MFS transporter, DHA1 family, multidrug resistance protein